MFHIKFIFCKTIVLQTGCDQMSFFNGKGKKSSWNVWEKYTDLASSLNSILNNLTIENLEKELPVLERFIVLLYDRTTTITTVNDQRKYIFANRGRSLESIPPTKDALLQHLKRSVYQGGHCWGQSMERNQILPDPKYWGWTVDEGKYSIHWTTSLEASKICRELIRCSCKKGCGERCKCVKATLKCTEFGQMHELA